MLCVSAAVAVVSATGCHRAAAPAAEARTLRIGTQSARETLPVLTDLLYADPLIEIDWHGRPSVRLAAEVPVWQDDGRTLPISVRPGVTFHDGTPVTAAAVVGALKQQKKVRGFEFVTSIESPRDNIVLIHLSRPDAFLLDALAGASILHPDKPDIGTGPFRLVKRTPVLRAERNPKYYRGMPGIEQVQITTYDTSRAAWAAMMRGEVDMVPEVTRESVEFLEGATRFQTYSSIRPFYIPLVFNQRHPILRNVEVRRAITQSIDRDEILLRAMRGHGQVADDPLWPFNWAYMPAALRHSFDPADAAARLDAAGLPVRKQGASGTMPSRFRIGCMFWDKDPQYERIALLLQRQLSTIGVDLVPEPMNQETIERRIKSGEFDTYIYQLGSGRSFELTYLLWHSDAAGVGVRQNVGYTGANEVLDRLRAAHSDSEVRIAVADLRERFYQDVPAAFIAWLEAIRAVDARFNVGEASNPEILASLWQWSVAAPHQRAQR
jgi:peptide/nickel transport system substrate-binding protein